MPRNNAQQVRRDPAFFLASAQPINVPSHYVFLLITQVMASSPLCQPRADIGRRIVDRAVGDPAHSAQIGRSHLRHAFLGAVGRRSKRRRFRDRVAVKPLGVSGCVRFMPTRELCSVGCGTPSQIITINAACRHNPVKADPRGGYFPGCGRRTSGQFSQPSAQRGLIRPRADEGTSHLKINRI
jgi:hypothetical protein